MPDVCVPWYCSASSVSSVILSAMSTNLGLRDFSATLSATVVVEFVGRTVREFLSRFIPICLLVGYQASCRSYWPGPGNSVCSLTTMETLTGPLIGLLFSCADCDDSY